MGQGQKNVIEDYYNIPGQIAGSGYEDKSLINKSGAQLFEGNFEGAAKTITSNVPRLLGELSIEIPLAVIPAGPALKLDKIGIQAVKTGIKILADPVVIKYIPKVKLQMLEKAIDAVNKGKPGAIKTVNTIVNNINKITTGRGKSSQFGKVENSLFKITENVGKEGHTTINKNIYDWKNIHNIIDTKIGPISADNTRLYRVDTTKTLASGKVSKETIEKTRSINDMFHQADNQGAVDAVGRWFNSGPDSLRKASFYLGDRFPSQITSIDVPKTIAKKYTISNLPRAHGQLGKVDPVKYSRDATEVFLPKSIANNKQYVMGANEFVNIVKNNKIKNIFGFKW